MTAIAIDRLTLKLSGLSQSDGERLARLVANGLGQASLSGAAANEVAAMSVNVQSDAGNNLNRLSDQIVSEILRQLTA
jgi:hypothetical protein